MTDRQVPQFGPEHDLALLREWDFEELCKEPRHKRDLMAIDYFMNSVLHITSQDGWTFTGCSIRQKGTNTNLTVKAELDGTPLVAFVTEKFPTGCVVTFCRMWLEGRVKWYPDRYA